MMRLAYRGPRAYFAASLLFATACGGDGAADSVDSTGSTESGESETSEGESFAFEGELEFTFYDKQPMVVDVLFRMTAPLPEEATVDWSHQSDAGVRFVALESSDPFEQRYRIRGLAPATGHAVDLRVGVEGEMLTRSGSFSTLAPLPGFAANLPVEGESSDPEVHRLLDWSSLDQRPGGVMFVDAEGQTRWYWGRSYDPGDDSVLMGVKLLNDGNIAYGRANTLVVRDELGESLWQLNAAAVEQDGFHHELIEMPNGNLMTMGYEFMIESYEGEGDYLIAGDVLIEVTREGQLVWTWSSFAHLDTQRVRDGFHDVIPPIIDPESGEIAKDWSHGNGIEYREEDGLLVVSFRHLDWLVGIDYPSGDVRWRLGDGGDFDLLEGSWFFHQHSSQWQPDGSLLLYDNGNGNPYIDEDAYRSRAVRYELDMDAMTATQVWEDDTNLQSPAMGDADRLPSGNVLVTDSVLGFQNFAESHAQLREMDPDASPQQGWTAELEDGRIVYRAMPVERWVGDPLGGG